jgi:hypothetical protein
MSLPIKAVQQSHPFIGLNNPERAMSNQYPPIFFLNHLMVFKSFHRLYRPGFARQVNALDQSQRLALTMDQALNQG